jgi:hypothetical protein
LVKEYPLDKAYLATDGKQDEEDFKVDTIGLFKNYAKRGFNFNGQYSYFGPTEGTNKKN